MLKVEVTYSGNLVDSYKFDQPVVTIGRSIENDLVLDVLGIRRHHCKVVSDVIFPVEGSVMVNGITVDAALSLKRGDNIQVEKFTLEVQEI